MGPPSLTTAPWSSIWVDGAQGHPLADLARTHIIIIGGDIPEYMPGRRLIELLRNTFYKAFIKEYFKHSPYAPEDLRPWIPIAAGARLQEGIKEEEESLIRIVKASLT